MSTADVRQREGDSLFDEDFAKFAAGVALGVIILMAIRGRRQPGIAGRPAMVETHIVRDEMGRPVSFETVQVPHNVRQPPERQTALGVNADTVIDYR